MIQTDRKNLNSDQIKQRRRRKERGGGEGEGGEGERGNAKQNKSRWGIFGLTIVYDGRYTELDHGSK